MQIALEVMDRPWEWGVADCCTSACDVFWRLHGIDPMASLRGRYSTEKGAARIIRRRGGFLNMARGLAAEAGLQESGAVPGAIGVVVVQDSAALVICSGPRLWHAKTLTGITTVPEVVEAWHVG